MDLIKNSKIAKSTDYFIKFQTLFKRLKTQESTLNSSVISALNSLKSGDLNDYISELEFRRNQDLQILSDKHSAIKQSMEILKDSILSSEKIKCLDVEFYRKNLMSLENQLSEINLYVTNNKNTLHKQEQDLCEEIKLSEKRLNDENNFPMKTCTKIINSPIKMTRNTKTGENKDVQLFQDFLKRTGGHSGGWGDVEHNAFIKCCLKLCDFKNGFLLVNISMTRLVESVQKLLPDVPAEEIISHYNWLLQYKHLKEMQNKSLEIWKALRDAHKFHKSTMQESKHSGSERNLNTKSNNYKTPELKTVLEIWNRNKDIEKKTAEDEKLNIILNKRNLEIEKELDRKLDKQDIKNWTEIKKNEMQARILKEEAINSEEKKKRAHLANQKIKEFRQRDQIIVNARKSHINELKKSKSCDVLENGMKKGYHLRSLKSQYDKPTEQWCRRIKNREFMYANDFPKKPKSVDAVDCLPKLRTPEWRQGITSR